MTMFPDAQRALLDHGATADLLLDLCHYLGPGAARAYASPDSVAALLRNLALLRRNKGRILAQGPLVDFLVAALARVDDDAATAGDAATALWALVHHSEKARGLLRASDAATAAVADAARALADADLDLRDDAAGRGAAERSVAALRAILAD